MSLFNSYWSRMAPEVAILFSAFKARDTSASAVFAARITEAARDFYTNGGGGANVTMAMVLSSDIQAWYPAEGILLRQLSTGLASCANSEMAPAAKWRSGCQILAQPSVASAASLG
jgi:hypothetical protein